MTKIKIGTKKFDAAPYQPGVLMRVRFGKGLQPLVDKTQNVMRMQWHCDGALRIPQPYPKAFPKVSSGFLIYREPFPPTPDKDLIRKETEAASRAFLDFIGNPSPNEFRDEMRTLIGTYNPQFDVDAEIAALKPTARLNIKVKLKYMHFLLTHKKFDRQTALILSLPDEVLIYARQTHRCTEEGVIEIPKGVRVTKLLSLDLVRAAKGKAHELRNQARKREAMRLKAEIKRLKDAVERLEAEMEAIKPQPSEKD